jgi:hypothetical protein
MDDEDRLLLKYHIEELKNDDLKIWQREASKSALAVQLSKDMGLRQRHIRSAEKYHTRSRRIERLITLLEKLTCQ